MKKIIAVAGLIITCVGSGFATAPASARTSAEDPVPTLAEAANRGRVKGAKQACANVTIRSLANNRLVSSELGYPGGDYAMLRARATVQGPWEVYNVCFGTTYDTIRSVANGRYVSAELGYPGGDYGMLRARANAIGPWERFYIASCGAGCVTIRSLANNRLVSAELGYPGGDNGMLRARANVAGPWERFQ